MPGPQFVARSYSGGAPIAYISAPMGATDTSFTITPTLGWVTPDSNPLGVDGPFVVAVDRGLATEEKILCTSINLSTGLIQVYNTGGFLGRGYDQTNATTHTPSGGSPLNGAVQVVWTAVEAAEANKVVTYILGTAGGSQADGEVLTWHGGAPTWGPSTPLLGSPAGRMYCSGGGTLANGSPTQIINMVQDFVAGGVTVASNQLTVPVAGDYLVTWSLGYNSGGGNVGAGGYYNAVLNLNGSEIRQVSHFVGSPTIQPIVSGADLVRLDASDHLTLVGQQGSGGIEGWTASATSTFVSAMLASA